MAIFIPGEIAGQKVNLAQLPRFPGETAGFLKVRVQCDLLS
jgi:hypothetical protein